MEKYEQNAGGQAKCSAPKWIIPSLIQMTFLVKPSEKAVEPNH